MASNVSIASAMAVTQSPMATNITYDKLSPPEYMYVYVTLCNAAMFVAGVIGNAMVIHVIARMRALRSRVNYFLGSLAVADLMVLMVCQPSAMLAFYTRDRWVLGYFMCKTVPFLEHWTLHASVLTLLVIGFERFFTICTPLAEKICHTRVTSPLSRLFIVSTFGLMFLIPLLLLIFLYSSVILTLRKLSHSADADADAISCDVVNTSTNATNTTGATATSHRRHQIHPTAAKSGRHRRQVSWMMVAIVVLFFVSLLPFKILSLFLIFTSDQTLEELGFESYQNLLNVARLMMYVNSAGNPIIYAWMSPRFRRAFHLSTPKCRCLKETPSKRGSFVQRYQPANNGTPQMLL